MSYTQWDKGWFAGWSSGYHAAIDDVRQQLLEQNPRASLEVFEVLNELGKRFNNKPTEEVQ